jgi:hypothetical protein
MGEKWPIKFGLQCDFHGNCRVFLHAAKLRHETDGFTFPPKEGMLTWPPYSGQESRAKWVCHTAGLCMFGEKKTSRPHRGCAVNYSASSESLHRLCYPDTDTWRLWVIVINQQSWIDNKRWFSSLCFGGGLTMVTGTKCYKCLGLGQSLWSDHSNGWWARICNLQSQEPVQSRFGTTSCKRFSKAGKKASYLQYYCRKSLVKRTLGRRKHRQEDNIKKYSQETVCGCGLDACNFLISFSNLTPPHGVKYSCWEMFQTNICIYRNVTGPYRILNHCGEQQCLQNFRPKSWKQNATWKI